MSQPPPIVLFAGGPSVSVPGLTEPLPVGFCELAGKPFFEFQLEHFVFNEIPRVVIVLAHGQEVMQEIIERRNGNLINLSFFIDTAESLGTGGVVRKIADEFFQAEEFFGVLGGGMYVADELSSTWETFSRLKRPALMTVKKGALVGSPCNVAVEGDFVGSFYEDQQELTHSDCGLFVFGQETLKSYPVGTPFDLGVMLQLLAAQRDLVAQETIGGAFNVSTVKGAVAFERFMTDI